MKRSKGLRRSALKAGGALSRKVGLKRRKVPKAFRARRDYDYQAWVRARLCLLFSWDCGWLPVECAHVKSRGAGGDDARNCIPLCHSHHIEQHTIGIRSFERRYNVDLKVEAEKLWERYLAQRGART